MSYQMINKDRAHPEVFLNLVNYLEHSTIHFELSSSIDWLAEKNALVADYFGWILNTYAPANAEGLGYAALTGNILTAAKAKLALVNSK